MYPFAFQHYFNFGFSKKTFCCQLSNFWSGWTKSCLMIWNLFPLAKSLKHRLFRYSSLWYAKRRWIAPLILILSPLDVTSDSSSWCYASGSFSQPIIYKIVLFVMWGYINFTNDVLFLSIFLNIWYILSILSSIHHYQCYRSSQSDDTKMYYIYIDL